MIDPTPNEIAAMEFGGRMGGEYLDRLGKTDLTKLTPQQWETFIEVIVTGYGDHLRDLAGRDGVRIDDLAGEVPF